MTLKEQFSRYRLLILLEQCAARIAANTSVADACLGEWQTLMQAADTLMTAGMPPSNVQVRDALLPILDAMPEALQPTRQFALVLREIDKYLAQRPPTANEIAAESALTDDVRRVAGLLRGRAIVLVGGDRRPHAEDKLTSALGIRELVWVDTKSYQSHTICEPHIARKDVAVVMLAIRWASHGLKEIKDFCDKYNKPLVYLPQGYNPNQVALRILQQCGERLEADAR